MPHPLTLLPGEVPWLGLAVLLLAVAVMILAGCVWVLYERTNQLRDAWWRLYKELHLWQHRN